MPTKIEWVKNQDGTQGETWNPVSGCSKISEGCRHCYAERMARRLAGRYGYPEQPHHFDVALHPDKLEQPLHWKKPKMVFVCSMSDWLHPDVPFSYAAKMFAVMSLAREHTFQLLTKRADRLAPFLKWAIGGDGTPLFTWPLPNIWLGVTAENQAAADERIPLLLRTPAAVRFVSCEPLLEAVILQGGNCPESPDGPWPDEPLHDRAYLRGICGDERINWVIVGGESSPGARPMYPDWARGLIQQCKAAGVPVFVKQMGTVWARNQYLHGKSLYAYGDTKGHEMKYWPEDLQVRKCRR